MKRSVVIHQPDFLPWLGFFERLLTADLFIALDHVQFVTGTSRRWTHRDKIKTSQGEKWLSLRVQKSPLGTAIRDIALVPDSGWHKENLDLLHQNYGKADYFDEIFPMLERLYATPHDKMVSLNLASLDLLEQLLDTKTPRMLSSEMSPQGSSTAMLLDLLKKAGATHYISGLGARDYLDVALLNEAGIEVVWQAFDHPVYPQQFGSFVPMLSSIDALFNCGISGARKILRGN